MPEFGLFTYVYRHSSGSRGAVPYLLERAAVSVRAARFVGGNVGLVSVGLIGASSDLQESCSEALKDYAAVRRLGVDDAATVNVVLISVTSVVSEGISLFARCREARPEAPILLVVRGVDVDLGVELVKCGATDLVSVRLLATGLRPKIERALGQRSGPALDLPSLRVLVSTHRTGENAKNRRRSFRVTPPSDRPAVVQARVGGREITLDVVDLSIPNEGWPGGMLLKTDAAHAYLLGKLRTDAESFSLLLPGGGPAIPIGAQPVSGRRTQKGNDLLIAVMYLPLDPRQMARLQAFWVECQRSQAPTRR